MLKKAGIVVVAAAAGLLAVSPLAFADDNDQKGLVNVGENNVGVPVQACGNDVLSGSLNIIAQKNKNSSDDEVECDQSLDQE